LKEGTVGSLHTKSFKSFSIKKRKGGVLVTVVWRRRGSIWQWRSGMVAARHYKQSSNFSLYFPTEDLR